MAVKKKGKISLDTYALILKAGVIMGQMNPKANADEIVDYILLQQAKYALGITGE